MAHPSFSSPHPYYPTDAVLSGAGYLPNDWSVPQLITTFAILWGLVLAITLIVVQRVSPRLQTTDKATVLWFVLTGSIHLFFEGYFLSAHHDLASRNAFFAQLWKEYSLSDSRYLISDPFLLSVESWTVIIIAPLSLLTALSIAATSTQTPTTSSSSLQHLRHPLQALTSTLHCYGNLLYFTTCLLAESATGKPYYRPEKMYFWLYFAGMNGIWFVVPGWLLYSSIRTTAAAFHKLQSQEERDANRKNA